VSGSQVHFTVCLDESLRDPAFAIQLLDLEGHRSNPLCFEGSTP
jgi:hypothetical protein